jgi:hypothetical protein
VKRLTRVNPEKLNGWKLLRNRLCNGLLNAGQHFGAFMFPRKSSRLNHFLDRPIWLLLALEFLFRDLAGTIVGTVSVKRSPIGLFEDRLE